MLHATVDTVESNSSAIDSSETTRIVIVKPTVNSAVRTTESIAQWRSIGTRRPSQR